MKTSLITFFLALSLCGLSQSEIWLHCGQLLDTNTGKIESKKTVVVEGKKILRIEDGYSSSPSAQTINLKDKLVMAGWIDMHVHLESQFDKSSYSKRFRTEPETYALQAYVYGKSTLMAGFTSVRDLGGTGANNAVRDAIYRGIVEGPRIFSARKSIAITGGHADPTNGRSLHLQGNPSYKDGVCDNPDECSKAVRWQVKQGADWIKITATGGVLSFAKDGDGPAFTQEEVDAIVATARDRGVHVAAHAHGKEGMLRAVKAGVKTIEHGTYMDDEVMDLMKKKSCYFIPTITAGWAVAQNAKIDGFFPELVRPKAARIGPLIQNTFAKAYKNGVPIGFGTDAGVFDHGKNAKEFELMVEGGMPIIECFQAATIINAKILEMEDKLGQIKSGFIADIIAVDPAALEDPRLLMEVPFVMKDGVIYKQ